MSHTKRGTSYYIKKKNKKAKYYSQNSRIKGEYKRSRPQFTLEEYVL